MIIKNKRDLVIGVIFLILAISSMIYAQLNTEESGLTMARGNMTPNSYPNFTLSAMAVFALLLIGANIRFGLGTASEPSQESSQPPPVDRPGVNLRAVGGIGLTALYLFLLPIIGYISSSIILLIMFILLFGGRNFKVIIPLSVGLSLTLYWFFAKVMGVLMP
jgi:hypothetical protein